MPVCLDSPEACRICALAIAIGMFGPFITLMLSKPLAKSAFNLKEIDPENFQSNNERQLYNVVEAEAFVSNDNTNAKSKYKTYQDVPLYRRGWCFWIIFLCFNPAAVILLALGDIYYKQDKQLKSFGIVNRIVVGIIGTGILILGISNGF